MAKIESIRPGGILDASFSTYPIPEILIGILRGNLAGRLDVFLHPEPRNHVYFKDGVPIAVDLRDSGVSLVQIMIEDGLLPQDRGLDLVRMSESTGRSQAALIQHYNLLAPGALDAVHQRRARVEMVRLFDAGPVEFRFTEGAVAPPEADLTILQPLPLVYEGLLTSSDRRVVARFVEAHAATVFGLGATYPRGVDPFGWGEQIEGAIVSIEGELSLVGLMSCGLSRDRAEAVLLSLWLADMVDVKGKGEAPDDSLAHPASEPEEVRVMEPRRAEPVASAAPKPAASRAEVSGLVIHRRGGAAEPVSVAHAAAAPAAVASPSTASASAHDVEYSLVRDRLGPLRDQNYFQLLRVTPGTDPAQIDRALRFLMRRVEEEREDAGAVALRDLLLEAHAVLREPEPAKRYGQLVERGERSASVKRDRTAWEAEPKVARAVEAMAEGRTGEATFLLSWAEKLDSTRGDVPVLFAMLDYLRTSRERRVADTRALHSALARAMGDAPHDVGLKLCQALVFAEERDTKTARRLLQEAARGSHPMARRVAEVLRSLA